MDDDDDAEGGLLPLKTGPQVDAPRARAKVRVGAKELAKMADLIASPPKASARLKAALKRHGCEARNYGR